MEKKQLLFVCYGLGIGGIEKCLVNLLNALPEADFQVDVMLLSQQDAMKPQIRRTVHFYNEFDYILYSGGALAQLRKRGGILKNLGKLPAYTLFHFVDKKGGDGWKLYKRIPKYYDVAVAYSQNGYTPYYCIDKVDAARKVLWYHNGAYDYDPETRKKHRKYFPQFETIVAVSRDCAGVLQEKLPYVRDKILVLPNLCDRQRIRENAARFVPDTFRKGPLHIVTVGRMTREKGALLALEACRILCDRGRDIIWHWVGDGEQAEEVREARKRLGLNDRFLLEGNQKNPYPYMACGDVYVQPSYYEAYSTTVTEAKVLCRPMVVTDVGGMRDQLTHEETALIVPVDAGAIGDAIDTLLTDEALRSRFSRNLAGERCGTEGLPEAYLQTVFR